MSTTFRWRVTLASLVAVFVAGLVLTLLLALGLADPPRAGSLQWQADSTAQINAPMALPAAYTLELSARNDGPAESAWGIRLTGTDQQIAFLIDNQGYLSVSTDEAPHWAEFPHIRPNASNQLYLHVEPGGAATLRINHEIAWEGTINAQSWSSAEHGQPLLDWLALSLYHE